MTCPQAVQYGNIVGTKLWPAYAGCNWPGVVENENDKGLCPLFVETPDAAPLLWLVEKTRRKCESNCTLTL